jgi:hypothetical protein
MRQHEESIKNSDTLLASSGFKQMYKQCGEFGQWAEFGAR